MIIVSQATRAVRSLANIASRIEYENFYEILSRLPSDTYSDENNEIQLITLLGSHVVILGSIDRLEDKLDDLRSFYLKSTDFVDLEKYKSVDLKYKNQIVCKKF